MCKAAQKNRPFVLWRNVDYGDTEAQRQITLETHQQMVSEGRVVQIPEETTRQVAQSYPDVRGMKRTEKNSVMRGKMKELKTALRQFLGGMKGSSFEFEVNGSILEATLYSTGIGEVTEKITQDKASMLYHSADVFKGAQYLYSTPSYDGDPNIYRWNYFYTPVQIGQEIMGVRIAVRDMVRQTDGKMDSQIYHWGIKKDASVDGGERGDMPDHSDVSLDTSSKSSIPQTIPGVNPGGGIATAVGSQPVMTAAEAQALYQPFIEAYAKEQEAIRFWSESQPLVERIRKAREDAMVEQLQAEYAEGFADYEAKQRQNQIIQLEGEESVEPEKPTGKTELTKSDDGSTIGEQKGKKITAITDGAIRRIPNVKVEIPGWTAEQCETINHWHKELLEFARTENEGKEVAFVLYPGQAQPQRFQGEEGSLKFKKQLEGTELIVMHNHPRNHSFSDLDIAFFLGHNKIRCLTIVKHDGGVELLIKTDEYDHKKALTEFKRSFDEHAKGKTDKQIAKAIYEFLRKGKGGFKWIKIDGGN